jgi:CubicO group peptidase (beta-lactamase class C family)
MSMILTKYPVAPTHHAPAYSNMAFQLLGYAMEKITGRPFGDLVRSELIKPLKLTRTFLSAPKNDSDAVVVGGWTQDLGDTAPYVPLLV